MQRCTMTKNKHFTSLKAIDLRLLVHYESMETKGTRTYFARKKYITMLTEPVKLCHASHTEHSINLQMKTTCYMREVSIKLANCSRNFATWPFSHQKNS